MTAPVAEPSAAVAILHARGPVESVLLMRRAERDDDPWSGHWSFPGGRRDPTDADLLDTALRELNEECGVALGREHLESALPPTTARRRTGPFLLVAPFVFKVDSELDAVPDLHEAVEARWVPLHVLRDPAQHRLAAIPGVPPQMLFPCVSLPGTMPLWGFTYRLITEWLGLLPDRAHARQRIRSHLTNLPPHRLGEPWDEIPPLNMVELRPDGLHVLDLDSEPLKIG